ncbi:uncharacterized protein LOC107413809 [Ziziphus jujuba]|uniref:Uncharacterized protein LOC107413809 n=2 Tax=Ziziphus jujuba TaxID=326968 RepID=A0A6P6G081_ZIZJJ|nr:uncharacterized protein LOC107413809 [Ziziphus jujuba]KAH7537523.1 hypothetical protein FEM48_Zijuj03G0102100 [Ziziphus jujuba var. spinosa]
MSRSWLSKNSIAFVWVIVLVCCLSVVLISMLRLQEIPFGRRSVGLYQTTKIRKFSEPEKYIGKFGKMMIEMLPEDLAFTVFVPSEEAFERDLRLKGYESLVGERMNDETYAIVSRILGFSAIPRKLNSVSVAYEKEIMYESISGFILSVSKDMDGMLVVNRVRSERVDLRKKEIIVHIMDGVVMDAEFEQSVQPDNIEEDE